MFVNVRICNCSLLDLDKAAHLCMQCLQEFPNKAQLRAHIRDCEGIKPNNKVTAECRETKVIRRSAVKRDPETPTNEIRKESGLFTFCVVLYK